RDEDTAGHHGAASGRESGDRRIEVHEAPACERPVEMRRRHTFERFGVHRAELEVRKTFASGPFASHLEQPLGEVHAEDGASRTPAVSGTNGRLPSSGREIENAHAGPKLREIQHPFAHWSGQALLDAVVRSPDFFCREERSWGCHGQYVRWRGYSSG